MSQKDTYFASPERLGKNEITQQSNEIVNLAYAGKILNSLPNMVAIINEHRQVIYANDIFVKRVGLNDFSEAIGQRPGELIQCIHANDTEYGCGTGRNCRYCGALYAVLTSQKTNTTIESESRITTSVKGKITALDLNVKASPFDFEGQKFTLIVMADIGTQKKQEQLERIFIHDLINSTWSLESRAELFPLKGLSEEQIQLFKKMKCQIGFIMEEVEVQRDLLRMEQKELETQFASTQTLELINSTVNSVAPLKISKNKKIVIDETCEQKEITTDPRLMRRVLINLIKNALEASKENETVYIGCKETKKGIAFCVKNSFVMNEEIKSQIFQRSFSTKGIGRGLGTYSIKILVEEYLNGKVTFESSKSTGTIFTVTLKTK